MSTTEKSVHPRAGILARTSYFDGPGTPSIESQLQMGRRYCAEHGYSVIVELIDHNVSGRDRDIGGTDLERGLDMARQGKLDVLVSREPSRLARDMLRMLLVKEEFARAGASIEYVMVTYTDSPEGRLHGNIDAVISQFDREKIVQQLKRGRYDSAQRGNVMLSANPPFGYRLVETVNERGHPLRTLEICDEEAHWIRKVYEWYVYGDGGGPLSLSAIAEKLTRLRILTAWDKTGRGHERRNHPPGTWHVSAVRRLLSSTTYKGLWTYNLDAAQDIAVEVPAIVGSDLWDRAQRRRQNAITRARRRTRREYLMRGRVTCHHCGQRMFGRNSYGKYSYYTCPGSHLSVPDARRCPSTSYRADFADGGVWEALKILLNDPALLVEHLRQRQELGATDNLWRRINVIDERIADAQRRVDKLFQLYLDDEYTQDVMQEHLQKQRRIVEQYENERADVLRSIDQAAEREARIDGLQELSERVRVNLNAAERDYRQRRQIVDILDATVRLETDGDAQLAHLDIDGEFVATIELPPTRRIRDK